MGTQVRRSDITDEYKWRIEDLFASDGEWENEFAVIARDVPGMGRFKGTLDSAGALCTALTAMSDVGRGLEKLYTYAHMKKDEDNSVTKYQAMEARMVSLSVELETVTAYVTPEILTIPKERLLGFVAQEPGLRDYEFMLKNILRSKAHVLDEPREQLLAQVSEIDASNANTFSMLDNVDMTFGEITDENGEKTALTHGKFTSIMQGKNRELRKTAYQQFYGKYGENKNTMASILTTNIKSGVFFAKSRRYESALNAALFGDNVSTDVYNNLIATVRSNISVLHDYMALKKRALKVDELHMYDVYAPITSYDEPPVEFHEARGILLDGLRPLGDEYANLLNRSFDERWMDVYENFGKRSGAYCTDTYGIHPFVLLNYQKKLDDVYTVAHELGHAMHSYFSNAAQPYPTAQYKIFVAEVASTVNEVLLTAHLSNTKDKARKASILNHYLEQFRGTMFRQVMFAEFEKITHELVEQGEPLNAERYMQVYGDLNAFYHGESMAKDDEIQLEWSRIPHFYSGFYVYKYATGFCAAVSIAERLLSGDKTMLANYLNFLKSGGSDHPIELLKIAGMDMSSPAPIEDGIKAFRKAIGELEGLM